MKIDNRTMLGWWYGILTVLFLVLLWVSFATYGTGHQSGFLGFAAANHVVIMASLVVVSILVGVIFSRHFYTKLREEQKISSDMLDTILMFLNHDERKIINYLVESEGQTTQAHISRIPKMTRVKAHRSLRKMEEKRLLRLEKHGKVVRVYLEDRIQDILQN